MLDRWEKGASKYGAGYDLYMASMQQPLPYPEHVFVNLVWAIESLHRNWQRESEESSEVEHEKKKIDEILAHFSEDSDKKLRKWLASRLKYAYEPTLEKRIIETFQRLPFTLDAQALREFANQCAKRRNDISHEGGQRPGENAESFRAELRQLSEALRYLFHALLLSETGLGRDLLLKALTRGFIGLMQVVPALRAVGIELPVTSEAE
jgi:transcriptional regulator of acetoin/glycerol metabolism